MAPGLSIKLNSAFVSDVVGIDGIEGANLKVVRQEFGGQVSTHVRCDISNGAVINVRPGAFKPIEGAAAAGKVVDKSAQVGPLTAKRRYLTTIVPEAGDVDITKESVLVSVGRGIGRKTTFPSPKSWRKRSARSSAARARWSMPSGCRSRARSAHPGRR